VKNQSTRARGEQYPQRGNSATNAMKSSLILLVVVVCLGSFASAFGGRAAASAATKALSDYSGAASSLFDNMRNPAAFIAGSVVPLGFITAPSIEEDDSKRTILFKKINMMLAICSLLNEVVAITYSTVAVNKIAEISVPPTEGVAQFIEKYYKLSWIGANVHFLFGLFGFGCLAVSKPYFLYGKNIGDASACWIGAALMLCVSVVNKGIAKGHGTVEDTSLKFANNLFGLVVTYFRLLVQASRRKLLPTMAFALILLSFVPIRRAWEATMNTEKED